MDNKAPTNDNPTPRHLRVFLASPGDVAEERALALKVLEQLQYDPLLRGRVTLETVAWDKPGAGTPLLAGLTPKEAIAQGLPKPSQCDMVIVILWSRIGTLLPPDCIKPDGSPYQSGTEWEYLDAMEGQNRTGTPEVLLYRRTEKVLLDPDEPDFEERARQRKKVQAFFACFQNPDGSLQSGVNDYAQPLEFKERLAYDLKVLIKKRLPAESTKLGIEEDDPGQTTDFQPTVCRYLEYVQDTHRYLSFRGMGFADRVPMRLPLLDLYVPLQARLEMPSGETWNRRLKLAGRALDEEQMQEHGMRLGEPTPVLELLRQQDGLVILGDPGAGKTTFLKYLALQLAAGQHEAIGLGSRLPVLVPLSGYANALEKHELRLDEHIANYFHDLGGDWPIRDMLALALKRGEALVLLDGLDEVADAGLRQTVVNQVTHFYAIHRKNGNKFVLTSRIVGYRDIRPTAAGLAECTLVDFNEDEIGEFIERWTAALESQAQGGGSNQGEKDAQQERQGLLEAVRHNPGVRQLAANPLLLTILALMKRQGVSLPERRAELYEQYVKTLLSSWNRARGLGGPPSRDLDPVQTVKMLAPLALWMHEANPGVGLVKREDLRRKLEALYHERNDADPEAAARQFLADVREHAGLLLERGPGEYGFIHLTFEEYLAAVGIALQHQGDAPAIAEALGGKVGQPAWHEIIRLTVGYVGLVQQMDRVAGEIVQALAAKQPGPPGEAVVLAGEAVADACLAGVDAESRARVLDALRTTMQAPQVPGKPRRQSGMLLGRMGWLPEDLDNFVIVPKGKFLYGEDKRSREIQYDYWISQYPVTNRQFARFIEADGYERREFWTETGWQWKVDNGICQPGYWGDLEFGNPLVPVVRVSWFEAMAYANWLDSVQAGEGMLLDGKQMAKPKDYLIRLPTEWEWERVARGLDGREYPWGNKFEEAYANCADEAWNSATEGTTAVCAYPHGLSPVGAWDMAGNVWEWCLNKYGQPDDCRLEGSDTRVLRGGSWGHDPRYARASYRFSRVPDARYGSIGFRLVCFSPITGL